MKFADYIDLIQREPTDLRIFFFDPIKHAPDILKDYIPPKELMGGFLDKYPSMFFGGESSVTFLHFDIDLAHIFHTHFNGRKHVLLFEHKWKDRLYKLPYTTYALEDYDIEHPEFEKLPGTGWGRRHRMLFRTRRHTFYANRMVALDEISGWQLLAFPQSLGQKLGCKSQFSMESYGTKRF